MSSLIPRYPGSKCHYVAGWDDGGTYDAVIEPFAGAGHFTYYWQAQVSRAFVADADPSVLAIWEAWDSPWLHSRVYQTIQYWQCRFSENPETAWTDLKTAFESSISIIEQAAASLVLRKLTFGGVVRTSASGKLNIKYCQDQIPQLLNWRYRFPLEPSASICLSSRWQDAVMRLSESTARSAIALVDPPYYLPKTSNKAALQKRKQSGILTPVYPGHKPHDPATLALCTDSVEALLKAKKVKRLIITNYYSQELNEQLQAIAARHDQPISMEIGESLTGLNRSRASVTKATEATWETGVRCQQQLKLWEAVA